MSLSKVYLPVTSWRDRFIIIHFQHIASSSAGVNEGKILNNPVSGAF